MAKLEKAVTIQLTTTEDLCLMWAWLHAEFPEIYAGMHDEFRKSFTEDEFECMYNTTRIGDWFNKIQTAVMRADLYDDDLHAAIAGTVVAINNNEYPLVMVDKDGVRVGCERFKHTDIKDIQDAIDGLG